MKLIDASVFSAAFDIHRTNCLDEVIEVDVYLASSTAGRTSSEYYYCDDVGNGNVEASEPSGEGAFIVHVIIVGDDVDCNDVDGIDGGDGPFC